ncbi:MAG: folylpolyglutamate synthase/dihydrofolate synthase family protein [Bacteroidales bacterium]|nr:folylpolyglutamate synthase/dihydrofolate synthase family protein [Bacteroidales bacterium]
MQDDSQVKTHYNAIIQYLYSTAPMFQQKGKSAYKEGLETTYALDELFHHPHTAYRTIHVAGTNGKGSVSSLLAATLTAAGYKVGLYTSPHLVDFRERIRINGEMISMEKVIDFVEKNKMLIEELQPSFFEITTAMAFQYFQQQEVDWAVIEVGLGGRLDCTNIIMPELSIITNISLDHTDLLGDTLEKIAAEKAGIIKVATPIVIGETQTETTDIFTKRARQMQAPIYFADQATVTYKPECELKGYYQEKNTQTACVAIDLLRSAGVNISEEAQVNGFANVCKLSGLRGRWQTLSTKPLIICDTGHNEGGYKFLSEQIKNQTCKQLRIVFGMVSDKKRDHVLAMLPQNAIYYFTQAQIPRAFPADALQKEAEAYGLNGQCYATVKEALEAAKSDASNDDFIFIGGSNFIVAEIL